MNTDLFTYREILQMVYAGNLVSMVPIRRPAGGAGLVRVSFPVKYPIHVGPPPAGSPSAAAYAIGATMSLRIGAARAGLQPA